jgi:glycosyltransferase involved in cell wall biosynthesis
MLVSVILPTYNRRAVLADAIEAVQAQTHSDLELIVVDDGSTDDTEAMMAGVVKDDPRVRYIKQANAGSNAARNAGLDQACGEAVAFMDSDDLWAETFLSEMLDRTKPGEIGFCTIRLIHLDGSEELIPPSPLTDVNRTLLTSNVVGLPSVLIRRQDLGDARFNARLRRLQDWDMWLTLLESGSVTFTHIDRPLLTARRQSDSISEGSHAIKDRALREIWRNHRRLFAARPYALLRMFARAWIRPLARPSTVREALAAPFARS